jgi:PPOX class probable F420-dependent enzyme
VSRLLQRITWLVGHDQDDVAHEQTLVMLFVLGVAGTTRFRPESIEGETPMKIPQTVRDVIEKGPFAHLTTPNPSGSPQVTVVWVGIEGEEFVMGHLAMHQKVKNIRRDPRVALSLLGDKTTQGMREYVVIYGNARVTEGAAVPLLQRLALFTSD